MKAVFCMILFVFRVCGLWFVNVSFVVIVDVIVADVFAAIITVDVDFLAVVINVNDTGVASTAMSADFVSLTFVIDVIAFDAAVVFVIDVIADIIFDIEVAVMITFVVVDFAAIIIAIPLLAVVNVVNVSAVEMDFKWRGHGTLKKYCRPPWLADKKHF